VRQVIKAILVTWTFAIAAITILSAGAPTSDPQSTQPSSPQPPQGTTRNLDQAGALPLRATAAGVSYVGSEACAQCHYDKFVSYMNQPHSHSGDPRTPGSRFGCESCHGPASNHVSGGGGRNVGGLMTFSNAVPTQDRNAVCLQCHTRGNTALWHGSTHDERSWRAWIVTRSMVGTRNCSSSRRSSSCARYAISRFEPR